MECYLEHLRAALYVLVLFDTLEACIDAMVINQHGANVHTLLKNQLALKGNGKFQKKRTTNTLCRLSIFKWLWSYIAKSLQLTFFFPLFAMVCSGSNLKKLRSLFGFCHLLLVCHLAVNWAIVRFNQQKVKTWKIWRLLLLDSPGNLWYNFLCHIYENNIRFAAIWAIIKCKIWKE